MSQTAEDLLIIYETEAQQWATYLCSLFTGSVSEAGICCYDIATASSRRDDFLRLSRYTCKLLILSKGMLESLCQMRRFFLARVLSPAAHVVVLLCGVDTLSPLLELVPLNGDECLQISSEQDAPEYLSAVTDIVRKASAANAGPLTHKPSGSEQKAEQTQPTGTDSARSSVMVIPPRVPCGSSAEVFILLRNEAASSDAEVEFSGENQMLRLKPVQWNERILCVRAPDFPAGNVNVTVFSGGVALSETQLQYYSSLEEITCLLSRVADPVGFMCEALQVSSLDKLDQKLASMLLEGMPTGGFQGLQSDNTPERELRHADVPSLLHFAAQYGFRSVSGLLLQCPGADRALRTANRHGQTPTEIAKSHGHTELNVLLKETLNMLNPNEDNGDSSVYEMMCNADVQKEDKEGEDEDLYAPLGMSDEYDTFLNSTKAVLIANRPPAPTPRPESTQVKESRTPYIAQVFQMKASQSDADLYSLPTKQDLLLFAARGREDRRTSTYDTFEPNQTVQQLPEQRVKSGLLTVDDAAERAVDGRQQEKPSHPRASVVNNGEEDDSVYDKINVVHHPPSVTVNESRRASQPAESDFYSKPLKGQQSNFFRKADKR
ncbi:B-cell scaffold protein with ankyrin repeats [Stegastes partitus]|uniref:B-cell scaffold protein with ankyrin repeats n=1 Tax=Stegastes partitus TaxID=144197 RepID=A0A9Y4NFB5_9TELE|nr:PREDICTED: B-cell scaffold protein with ankyrin repeats [Stegastes partitus]